MTKATTIISGYLVELEVDDNVNDCWVSFNDRGTFYNASLAALDATGMLENLNGRERRVPRATIERIADWAVLRGYDGVFDDDDYEPSDRREAFARCY